MANRAYLLSLPFPPQSFGDQPPSGTVAYAKYTLPLCWATLFDASSIIGPTVGGLYGLAAPRLQAGPRSERRLRAIASYFGWSSWPLVDQWIDFLRSLEQPWIAVDAHDLDLSGRRLHELVRVVDGPPTEPAFEDYFGAYEAEYPWDRGDVLAGIDHEGIWPPAPLRVLRPSPTPLPPPIAPFAWSIALEGLLAENDPAAWARYFPHARPAAFRSDVAVVAPGAYLWYSQRAQAWTVLWASCEHAAMEVFGVIPSTATNETYPPLPPDIVGLAESDRLTYERLVAAAQQLGDPVAPGRAPRPSRPPFETLVDRSTITYFNERAPVEEPYAILFRGAPNAAPWN